MSDTVWIVMLADGTELTYTPDVDGLPVGLADGSTVYLEIHP